MFGAIKSKIKIIDRLSIRILFKTLFDDKEFTDYIIELNTIEQLYKKGINSKGESIGDYSWYTKAIKTEKGQPTDRVTLKDTGEFYNSFITYWNDTGNGEIQIDADTIKEGGDDLLIDWGRDIIGLSEESLSKLRDMARIKLKQIVLEKLAA